MEAYSKAVREMYSQFKKVESHPMEKYVGRHVFRFGRTLEVVGCRCGKGSSEMLIIEAPKSEGWKVIEPHDVVFKACEYYWYASTFDVID